MPPLPTSTLNDADVNADVPEVSKNEQADQYSYGEAEQQALEATEAQEDAEREGTADASGATAAPADAASAADQDAASKPAAATAPAADPQKALDDRLARIEQHLLAQAAPATPVALPPPPAPEAEPFTPFDMDVKLDPDNYDEGLVKFAGTVKAMNKHYAEQVKKLHEKVAGLNGLHGSVKQQQANVDLQARIATQGQFEARIAALGDSAEEKLGKGSADDLTPGGPELKSRQAIWNDVTDQRDGCHRRGASPPSEEAMFAKAYARECGDVAAEQASAVQQAKITKRKGQAISKPTAKKNAAVTGDEAAARTADQFYKDHGVAVDTGPSDEF